MTILPSSDVPAMWLAMGAIEDVLCRSDWLRVVAIDALGHVDGAKPDDDLVEAVAAGLGRALSELLVRLIAERGADPFKDSIMVLDACLVDWLRASGRCATANRVEREARGRLSDGTDLFELWRPGGGEPWRVRVIDSIARLLAGQIVKHARDGRTALTEPLVEAVLGAMYSPGRRALPAEAGRVAVVDRDGVERAFFRSPGALREDLVRELGVRVSGSLVSQRLLRWIVARVALRQCLRLHKPHVLTVRGGFDALSQRLGVGADGKAPGQLSDLLDWLRHITLVAGRETIRGLLTWTARRPAPGCPAELEIAVGPPLAPGFEHQARKGTRGRRLVPIPAFPPFVPKRNHHAAQAALQLRVMVEFRDGVRTLVQEGHVPIDRRRWIRMADELELPKPTLDRLLAAWKAGDEGRPPFLVELRRGCWTLAPSHARELDMLLEAGRRELGGQRLGRRAHNRKAKRFERLGRKPRP